MYSKQFAFVVLLVLTGTVGSLVLTPVLGLGVYYFLAVLRPNFWWGWALPDDPGWSRFVAVATLGVTALWYTGFYAPPKQAATPWHGNPKYTRAHYLFLAFVGWISLTYPTAQNTARAAPYFEEYVKIFVMFLCGTLILRTVKDVWLIYAVCLGAVMYIAYEANMYYVFSGSYNVFMRYEAAGQDSNWAGLTLAMAVPMCYFATEALLHRARQVARDPARQNLAWGLRAAAAGVLAFLAPILHAIMFSYSRGAMVSMLAVCPVVLYRAKPKWLVLTLGFLGAAALPIMAGKEIRDRFATIGKSEQDASAQSRTTTWKIAIGMANEKPIFGFGIRNSNLYTYARGADMEGRTIHSQYFQTAADSGWVGLGLYLALLAAVFVALWQTRRSLRRWQDPETDRVRSLLSGIECALLVFCVGAVFLSLEHFEMPYILMLLALQLYAISRAVEARLLPRSAGPAGPVAPPAPPPVPARVAS